MVMRWTIFMLRNRMNIDIKNVIAQRNYILNTRLLLGLTKRNTKNIALSITMPSKLKPNIKFLTS
jgi:hypothetical protein